MKIKELKELIKDMLDDREVMLSSDTEGNNFHSLEDYGTYFYIEEKYGIELLDEGDLDDLDDPPKMCLVLWP